MNIETIVGIIGGGITIIIAIIAIYRYYVENLKIQLFKDNQTQLTELFESTVSKLSSNKTSEKISAAILLRRFFDKSSSSGVGGAPLAKETVDVISSMLKIEPTGDFQKLLADSLIYAPNLKNADLQSTNLKNAVLGKKGFDFTGADFYRANLTDASFKDGNVAKDEDIGKGGILRNTAFYETILDNTNFTGADLKGVEFTNVNFKNTNFTSCDLTDAKFKNVTFKNTNFNKCEHPPKKVQEYIDLTNLNEKQKIEQKIFISNPRIKTVEQQVVFDFVCNEIARQGFTLELIEKIDEQNHAVLTRIKDKIDECSGILIFDFKQYKIITGRYRWWSKEESKKLKNIHLSTPWIYLEAGMGIMKNIPMYIITDLVNEECIFNEIYEDNIVCTSNIKQDTLVNLSTKLKTWLDGISS